MSDLPFTGGSFGSGSSDFTIEVSSDPNLFNLVGNMPFNGAGSNLETNLDRDRASYDMDPRSPVSEGFIDLPHMSTVRGRNSSTDSPSPYLDPRSIVSRGRNGSTDSASPYLDPRSIASRGRNGSTDSNPDSKQKARMARKAELARISRLRKKHYISGLESQIVSLSAEISRLEQAGGGSLKKAISDLSISDDWTHTLSSGIHKIENAMEPGIQAKYAVWGLSRPDEYYLEENNLWDQLMRTHVGISDEQHQELMSHRLAAQRSARDIQVARALMGQLRVSTTAHLTKLSELRDIYSSVLTAQQLRGLVEWVQSNQWVSHLVDSKKQ